MRPNYSRPEQYGFTIEQHGIAYKQRYPNGGPSVSSDCGGEDAGTCGCWVCQMIQWRKEYKGLYSSGFAGGKV